LSDKPIFSRAEAGLTRSPANPIIRQSLLATHPHRALAPAQVTRDPAHSIPLKNNARYKVLEMKLEAESAESRKSQ